MLSPLSSADAQALRTFFDVSGYTDPEFRRRGELTDLPSKRAGNLSALLEATAAPSPQNLLLRLFLFGLPQEPAAVEAVAPREALDAMLRGGLLVREDGCYRAVAMLVPVDTQLIAADPLWKMESDDSSDAVVWPNPTTRMLQSFAIRTPSGRTLDLGSGCGVIAATAAAWSDRVIATDLNPRAAAFTAFNASLNGIENIENLTGDTFGPVAQDRFDRILANPPFFVTPSSGHLYCENPMELDGYCRRVVREGAAHLRDGGFLQMVCEWVQLKGQPWQQRLAEWVEGLGCDAWIVRTYAGAAAAYAWQRVKASFTPSSTTDAAQFELFMDYYRARGVEQVHGGILALRRRSGDNWLRIEEGQLEAMEPFGSHVLGVFANQDVLSAPDSERRLLLSRPRLAGEAHIDQRLQIEDGEWRRTSMTIVARCALPSSLGIEPPVADFLLRCDGVRTLDEMIQQMAAAAKAPVDVVRPQVCAVVRKAAERRIIFLN